MIELSGEDETEFAKYDDVSRLSREEVCENLYASGLWTALRTRPFGQVPIAGSVPHSIFVTAMDTEPLAASTATAIDGNEHFALGLHVLRRLSEGPLFLCKAPGTQLPGEDLDFVTVKEFGGPHPAGLPGTHIHFLDPVSLQKTVWHVQDQDVLAMGRLFATGRLPVERVISLAGPLVSKPRLLRTRLGASTEELTAGQLDEQQLAETDARVISGSVLSGRQADGTQAYLGRYHRQVSVLAEGTKREFLGWQAPGFNRHSVKRVFAAGFAAQVGRLFKFTTSTNGSPRAMVPVGSFEQVMPLDILPTFLLRALLTVGGWMSGFVGAVLGSMLLIWLWRRYGPRR